MRSLKFSCRFLCPPFGFDNLRDWSQKFANTTTRTKYIRFPYPKSLYQLEDALQQEWYKNAVRERSKFVQVHSKKVWSCLYWREKMAQYHISKEECPVSVEIPLFCPVYSICSVPLFCPVYSICSVPFILSCVQHLQCSHYFVLCIISVIFALFCPVYNICGVRIILFGVQYL
jgi:hypothetical protein